MCVNYETLRTVVFRHGNAHPNDNCGTAECTKCAELTIKITQQSAWKWVHSIIFVIILNNYQRSYFERMCVTLK